eukprot:Lankesteria_metandrocarpae@DN5489_c3_g1_i1.p1
MSTTGVVSFAVLLIQSVYGGLKSDYLIKAHILSEQGCPVMHVYSGRCQGLYHAFDVHGSWKSNDTGDVLARIEGVYQCGLESEYSIVEGQPQFGSTLATAGTMAQCVFDPEFCPTLKVESNGDYCSSGDYTKASNWSWVLPGSTSTLHSISRMNEDNDLAFGCYDRDSSDWVEHTTNDLRLSKECINPVMPELPKYGYNTADGETVFVTGPESPLGFIEGRFFKLFQMVTPEDGSDVTVYPYAAGDLGHGTVTKVSVPSMGDDFAVLPVIRYDAGNSLTFRLKLVTHGPAPGAIRVNILQVKDGVHYHSFDSNKVVIASIVSNSSAAGGAVVINYHSGFTFPENKLPIVLGQVISSSAEYEFYRVYDRTTTGFTAVVPVGAELGYIAVHAGGRSSGLFGPNMLAVTTYEDSTAAFA